jgi:acetyl-CoA synthetase
MTSGTGLELPSHLNWMRRRALEDPEDFWGKIAEDIHWFKPWDRVFKWEYPEFSWFPGAETNISYNCLDYHLSKGRGNRAAIIWESGEGERTQVITYNQLHYRVERFAAALRAMGVNKGDRVTIYMPMIPEAAIAMLATTRIGAVHSVVFGGYGYGALADRIIDAESRIVITSDVGYRKGKPVSLKRTVDQALAVAKCVEKVVVLEREGGAEMVEGRDITWDQALDLGRGESGKAIPVDANHLAFILYTSGTMSKPKGTVQPHGSYQVWITAMAKWVYDMKPEDVWWSTSDVGWIVGHSYVVYAPLLIGCSTIMYEGVPTHPSPDIWWDIIERNRVTQLWISPTGVRALMQEGIEYPRKHDLSSLRLVLCAGEVLNPPAYEWLHKDVLDGRVPVIDHMWQTESSGPMVGNPYGICMLPIKSGAATIPLPGIDADVVDEEGKSLPPGSKGNFVVRKPFPGLTPTLWRDHERYLAFYWNTIPGVYYTGDSAIIDEDGYVWFQGRADEVIKISAHRIGTIEIESALLAHPKVAETAVVGEPDELRGEVAAAFVVLNPGESGSEELAQELRTLVRDMLGPIVIVGHLYFVTKVPKTRSGKIMRRILKSLMADKPLGDYTTIEDPSAIEEVKEAIKTLQ